MSRDTLAATTSAAAAADMRFRLLVEVHSLNLGGVTRACNGYNHVLFNGNTYSPIGNLGGIDKIQEESDVFPRQVRMWFAAVSSEQIADVLGESLFNCPLKVLRAFLTESLTLVASAEELWRGFVEEVDMKLKDPEKGNHFTIVGESRMARPPSARFFNNETHQYVRGNSGDVFFAYVHAVAFNKANWGTSMAEGFHDPLPRVLYSRSERAALPR